MGIGKYCPLQGERLVTKIILLSAFMLIPIPAAGPQAVPPLAAASPDSQAIGGIAEAWMNAYNSGDAAKTAALYADDGYYLSAHILAHGRAAIEAYWKRGIAAGGHIDLIKPLKVFASGELGYCAGVYQATNAGVTVDGRILLVFRKMDGKWLIAAHETVVRDQP